MKKITILIVEDHADQAKKLQSSLEKEGYEVAGIAQNLKDALGLFYSKQPDLVILDIYLDGKPDGIVFAQKMNENENTARPIIFLTQHTDYKTFKDAKLVAPYNYLLKPFNPLELQYSIELAFEKYTHSPGVFSSSTAQAVLSTGEIFVKTGPSIIKILLETVCYIEVEGKYSRIHADDRSFLIQQSLKGLEERLPNHFLRIHRNFLINVNKIHRIQLDDCQVILLDGKGIPFSPTYREKLMKGLDILK